MSLPTIEVNVALGIADAGEFVVGSSLVGGSDVIGDGATSVATDSYAVSISRGRFSQLWDSIDAGTCRAYLHNNDRDFDPTYTSSPYYGYIVPGRLVKVRANGIDIFTGYVDDWDLGYDVAGISTATVVATDALGMFGKLQFDAWTSSSTTVDGKLHAICDRSEVAWPAADRDFDNDFVTLQSDAVSWGSNVLNYAQLVARSNLGYLFASKSGVLTFRDRYVSVANGGNVAQVEFADDGTGVPYQGIAASIGSEVLFARVSVDREGGTAQSSTVADTAAWIESYGPLRSLSIAGLLLSTDAQSLALAADLLADYDEPVYRITEIVVDLTPLDTADQDAILALEIPNRVSVTFTPDGVGSAITQIQYIQGIRHDISTERHVVTLSLITGTTQVPV